MQHSTPTHHHHHPRRRLNIRSAGQWFMGCVIFIYSSILVRLVVKRKAALLDNDGLGLRTNGRHNERDYKSINTGTGAVIKSVSPTHADPMVWRKEVEKEEAVVNSWYEEQGRILEDIREARRTERKELISPASTIDWTDLRQKKATTFASPTQRPSELDDTKPFASDDPNNTASWCRVYGIERELNATAKVLITGIVSSPVGVNLALYLSTHCQVSTIIGVDHLLPNTMSHRLKLMSGPLNMLSRVIPKFTLDVPLMGLEPPPKSKTSAFHNWMDRHSPTHVVHLQPMNAERIFARRSAGGPDEPRMTDVHPTPLSPSLQKDNDEPNQTWWSVYGSHRPIHAFKQLRMVMDEMFGTVLESYKRNELRQRELVLNLEAANQLQNDLGRMGAHALGAKGGDDLASSQRSAATLDLPHIVYASSHEVTLPDTEARSVDLVARAIAMTNERIAAAYASPASSKLPIPSVGVRFGTVYGPYDHFMSPAYQAAERFWANPNNMAGGMDDVEDFAALKDWVYVDDAVRAVLMAMQLDLSRGGVHHRTMDVTSGAQRRSIRHFVTIAKELATELDAGESVGEAAINKAETSPFDSGWVPTTPLKLGVKKMLAWHYEQANPFPPTTITSDVPSLQKENEKHQRGQALLQSPDAGIAHCAHNDTTCHRGSILTSLPCSSECSFSQYPGMCAPSMWDSVKEVIQASTQDCRYALYTIALGRDVTVMPHRLSSTDQRFDGETVCNIAIIPQESELAMNIIRRIPNEDGTTPTTFTEADASARFKEYNGVVEADGWTAVWVPPVQYRDAKTGTVTTITLMESTPFSNADLTMLKMAPGGFFDSSVLYAMYVDENFNVSPTQDDVEFLISEVDRAARPARTVKYYPPPPKLDENEEAAPIQNKVTTKPAAMKFRLPPEKAKRAILLLSPIRKPENTKKLTTNSATKLMLHELGLSMDASAPLKKQRTWYESMASKVNKDSFRSMYEPLHRYSQAPFYTRSKWLIHDLRSEDARQLRCEWYHEHILWDNELDALSISAVLARRDIERKIKWNEVDQREKLKLVQTPESITDENDWAQVYLPNAKQKKSNLYVRIMTDAEMLSSRKKWVTKKKKKKLVS